LAWRIDFANSAAKQLRTLDPVIARRITVYLRERVSAAKDPRTLGAAVKGDELGQFWKYRDYRIIAEIRDRTVQLLVVPLGRRRDVYC